MIYLIGGPPRCGKSTLAKRLSEKLGISLIPTDLLDNMLKPYFSEQELVQKYPKDELRKKTHGNNEEMYSTFSAEKIVNAYMKQGEVVEPALIEIFDYYLAYKQDVVMEGFHLSPAFVSEALNKYGNKDIKSVFLIKENVKDVLAGIESDESEYCWVKNKSKSAEIYPKIAEMISLFSSRIKKEAEKEGLKVIEFTDNFANQLEEGLNYFK